MSQSNRIARRVNTDPVGSDLPGSAPAFSGRAAYLLRYIAIKDAVEQLRHDAEDAVGIDEALDLSPALERVEHILANNLPRLLPR